MLVVQCTTRRRDTQPPIPAQAQHERSNGDPERSNGEPPRLIVELPLIETPLQYWDSKESLNLYGDGTTKNPKQALSERIRKLTNAYLTVDGYKEIIHDKDEQSLMSDHDIFVVHRKYKYMKYEKLWYDMWRKSWGGGRDDLCMEGMTRERYD